MPPAEPGEEFTVTVAGGPAGRSLDSAPPLTRDAGDLGVIADLVQIREP